MIYCELSSTEIDIAHWIAWAKDPKAGAVVYFGGTTRDSFEGNHVVSLAYDAYVPRAQKSLQEIAQWAQNQKGVQNVVLIHRIGIVPLMQESVCIVIAASHRGQGWDCAREVLERVKQNVEIWKKERFDNNDESWVPGIKRNPDLPRPL